MIEAVKSTVANSALSRTSIEQSSTLTSFAANPEKSQVVSQTPYVSPTVRVDVNTKIAILEFRESITGEVIAQIPSEQALRSYRIREAKEDVEIAAQLMEKTNTQNGESVQPTRVNDSTSAQATPAAATPAPAPVVSDIGQATEVLA